MMVLGNSIDQTAIRSGITVTVLPRIVHGFQDAFRRSVRILIVRKLYELVVVPGLLWIERTLRSCGSLPGARLTGKPQRPQSGVTQDGSHVCHELASSNVRLHIKPPLSQSSLRIINHMILRSQFAEI